MVAGPPPMRQFISAPRFVPEAARLDQLLEDDERVRTADAQRVHPRPPRMRPLHPRRERRIHVEPAAEVDLRIRLRVVQRRIEHPVLEREHRLDEPGDTGHLVEMAEVRFNRTDRAMTCFFGTEGLAQCGDLNWVTQLCGGSVRLNKADRFRINRCQRHGFGNHIGLAVNIRSGEPDP